MKSKIVDDQKSELWQNNEMACAFAYLLTCYVTRGLKSYHRNRENLTDDQSLSVFKNAFRDSCKTFYENNVEALKETDGAVVFQSFWIAFEDFVSNTVYFTGKYYQDFGCLPPYKAFRTHWGGDIPEETKYNVDDVKRY